MNSDQLAGIARVLVPTLCAWLAANGFSALSNTSTVAAVTTAVVAIGAAGWSIFANTSASKLKSAAGVDPGIKITVPPAVSADSPSIQAVVNDSNVPNVTAPSPAARF